MPSEEGWCYLVIAKGYMMRGDPHLQVRRCKWAGELHRWGRTGKVKGLESLVWEKVRGSWGVLGRTATPTAQDGVQKNVLMLPGAVWSCSGGFLRRERGNWLHRLIILRVVCNFPPPLLPHAHTRPLLGQPLRDREGRKRSQPAHGRRGAAALTTPSRGATCGGTAPGGAPRPCRQPAGSPALSRKAVLPRLLWGSPWESAGALSQLWPRRGRAEKKIPSNPHLQENNGVGRGGGKTGRTTQLTCQPRSSLFLQEANPRLSRGALPRPRRGDKDERRLQPRGPRPPRPASLRGVSAPRTAALQHRGQRQRHAGPRPLSAALHSALLERSGPGPDAHM